MKNLNKLTETETRELNGGYYYCKVCYKTSNSFWTIFKHIAVSHPREWGKNFCNLILKVF